MKKFITRSLFLIFFLNTNFTSAEKCSPFIDMNESTTEGKATTYLKQRGIINGVSEGKFNGTKEVNRAEITKMLLLARGIEVDNTDESNETFSDLKDGEWYLKYINKAYQEGIIDGYPDGTFQPSKTVNTVEFLKMCSKIFLHEDYLNDIMENFEEGYVNHSFSDIEKGSWYEPYLEIASRRKLFPQRKEKILPENKLTRNEVAVALYQYLKDSPLRHFEEDVCTNPTTKWQAQKIETLDEYYSNIDYSCNSDSDCVKRDTGGCCGYMPACVNREALVDPDFVQKACRYENVLGVCGFPEFEECHCNNNQCAEGQRE